MASGSFTLPGLEDIGRSVSSWFSAGTSGRKVGESPQKKKTKGSEPNPFNEEQGAWLNACLQETLATAVQTVHKHVERRIAGVEKRADEAFEMADSAMKEMSAIPEMMEQIQTLTKEAQELKARPAQEDPALQEVRKAMADLQAKEEARASQAQPCQPNPSPAPVSGSVSVPYEQRTEARIGCLGWDTDRGTLLARGKELLRSASVPDSDLMGISAVAGRNGGSACEAVFVSAPALQGAKLRVQNLQRESVPGRVAWLDVKKGKTELDRNRLIHRAAEIITEYEEKQDDKKDVTKNIPGLYVRAGTEKAAYVLDGRLKVTTWGLNRYGQEATDLIISYSGSN